MRNPVCAIFGVGGLIGKYFHDRVCETLPDYRVFSFDHSHVDASNRQDVKEIIGYVNPTIVINCVGVSDPVVCEQARSGAIESNALAAQVIAEQCKRVGAKMVHFSTCAVFSGDRFKPYSERCKPNPVNYYGKSKLVGEREIQSVLKDYLIIRPGWIFHSDQPNFLINWIAQIDRKLNIVVPPDVHGSPVFLPDLVDATRELIDRGASGVFHIANSQASTWESLAEAVIELTHGASIITRTNAVNDNTNIKMPQYTVLSTKKLKSATRLDMRPWPNALKQCLFQLERYKP